MEQIKTANDLIQKSAALEQKGMRDGFEIDKGAILNEDYLTQHFDEIGDLMSFYTAYPDL